MAGDPVRCLHPVRDHGIHEFLNPKPDAPGVQPGLFSDVVPVPTGCVAGFAFPTGYLLGVVLVYVIPVQDS
ncbi:MAG: hypothetical protein AAF357_16285 [Verrucomicrobiota bacterium]